MNEQQKLENWLHYSTVWRNILTHVLEWPAERADQYIEDLRRQMDASFNNPLEVFGFFYDPPTHYLFRPILGNGLHERIMQCKSDEANPSLIFQRLVAAISDNVNHWEMDGQSFDWNQARQRYQSELRRVEELLRAK
jgi:hypothetical protein